MPRNWRCANGHTWTGDLGALTFCPECGSADVYEVRPQYESGQHGVAPPPPADDAGGQTFIQHAPAAPPGAGDTFIQSIAPRPASGDTFVQAVPLPANVGDTFMQPAMKAADSKLIQPGDIPVSRRPSDPGTTIIQAFVPVKAPVDTNDEPPPSEQTFIQPPALTNGPAVDGGTIVQPRPAAGPVADGGTLFQAPAAGYAADGGTLIQAPANAGTLDQPAVMRAADGPTLLGPALDKSRSPGSSAETRVYQGPADGASAAVTPTLDAPVHGADGGSTATTDLPGTVEHEQAGGRPPGISKLETRPATSPRSRDGRPAAPPPVDGYEILGVLGRGGMGVVYKARQVRLNRLVALKMILAGGHAGTYERQRFKTEGEAVAHLQHPNIVQIYEVGEKDGLPYFSLEFCDGGSLQQKLGGQPLPPKLAADVAEQLARAMQYAHERGIVHRDLKPANILFAGEEAAAAAVSKAAASKDSKVSSRETKVMTKDSKAVTREASKESTSGTSRPGVPPASSPRGGTSSASLRAAHVVPKVTDFGLAKKIEEDSGLTGSGTILGTPSYMAPEQAAGLTKAVGPPADIHALGAILYEMLTGRPPFLGESVVETMRMVREVEPVPPTRLQPRTPRDLETVCLKCLQKEMHKRYATSGDLADDLRRFLDGEPIAARPVSTLEKGWKWAKRRPAQAGLIGMAAAVLIAAAVGGVAFGRYQREQRDIADGLKLKAQQEEANAKEQERLAIANADRAKQNFRDARAAVGDLLSRIGAERLSYVPQAEKLRSELLQEALIYCKRFMEADSSDPEVRQAAVWAHLRVGLIRMQFDDRPAAIAEYREALKLYGPLAQGSGENPDDRKDLLDLIDAQRQLTILLEVDRKPDEADKTYESARAALRDLVAAKPDRAEFRLQLAKLYTTRAAQLGERDRADDAEAVVRQALDELDRLARDNPDPANVLEQCRARTNLGAFFIRSGRSADAIVELRRSIADLNAAMRRKPDDPTFAAELGRAYLNLGVAFRNTRRADEAVLANQEAVAALDKLVADYPKIADYRYYLGLVHDNVAQSLKADKGLRAAEAEWAVARELFGKLVAESPANAEYRRHYSLILEEQAAFLKAADRLDEAIEAERKAVGMVRGLAATDPLNPAVVREHARRHWNLGQLYAHARRADEAQAEYTVAVELLEGQADRRLPNDDSWYDLPMIYMNLGLLFQAIGKEKPAEQAWRNMTVVGSRLMTERPGNPDFAAAAAVGYFRLAKIHAAAAAVALNELRTAVRLQRAALAIDRQRADMADGLGIYGSDLVETLSGRGDHKAAAKAAEELEHELPASWGGRPRLAGLVARCIRVARTDNALAAEAREAAVKDYAEQAFTLLRKSVVTGFKDAAALRESPDLEVLRTDPAFRPAFEKVLADVEANNKAGPK